jgi:sphingolipid delta-4 desaturase
LEHHKYLGEDGIDVDLPTRLELLCLNNVLGKVFFWFVSFAWSYPQLQFNSTRNSTFQILFYALRPGFVRSQKPTYWHFIGIATQLSFDFLVATYVPGGMCILIYLIMSSFWAGSLHPLAGHFIAEHYVWDNLQQETYSYYGWMNILAYNVSAFPFRWSSWTNSLQVGYHNEHHDFPSVPWTRLPALRALAPEFYDTIPSHPSWPMVVINFIRDRNVGLFARVKRPPHGNKITPPTVDLDGGCADEWARIRQHETKEGQGETVRQRR